MRRSTQQPSILYWRLSDLWAWSSFCLIFSKIGNHTTSLPIHHSLPRKEKESPKGSALHKRHCYCCTALTGLWWPFKNNCPTQKIIALLNTYDQRDSIIGGPETTIILWKPNKSLFEGSMCISWYTWTKVFVYCLFSRLCNSF